MADAFISYSRKDQQFVRKLDETLKQRERNAWVDWEGIMPSEEFMQAIYKAIDAADTFIFVLTPDSVISPICALEIEHAVARKKRLVPLVVRDVNAAQVPEALAKLNWIFCREADPFDAATATLFSALDTDLDWVRAHTRLIMRAVEWENNGRNDSFLMRGVDLRAAESWLSQAGAEKERQPTALQTEYILASRTAAVRRQRLTLGAVAFGAVLAVVLAILAWQQRGKAVAQEQLAQANAAEARAQEKIASANAAEAQRQEKIATANAAEAQRQERKAKVETSHTEYLRGSDAWRAEETTEALRSLGKALQFNPANTEAATALINLLGQRRWPHLAGSRTMPFPIGFLRGSPDAQRIVATGDAPEHEGQLAKLSIVDSGTLQATIPLSIPRLEAFDQVSWNHRGDRILATGYEHFDGEGPQTILVEAKEGKVVKQWTHQVLAIIGGWFSQDGEWAIVCQENTPEGVAPRRWLEIVSAADGKPHPTLPRVSVAEKPLSADLLQGELRLVQSDGRVTAQTVANPKKGAMPLLLTVQDIGKYKGLLLAPNGRSLAAAGADGFYFWNLRPPGAKPAPPDSHEPNFLGETVFNREFASYKIEASLGGVQEVTFEADFQNSWGETLRQVLRARNAEGSDPELVDEWTGRVSPIAVLPEGILGASGTRAFLAPFQGGAFSGEVRHSGEITGVCALGADAAATGSVDGDVKVWRFSKPAFAAALQSRPLPDRPPNEQLARNRKFATKPVELWTERFAPPSTEGNTHMTEDRLILIRGGERRVLDLGPEGSAPKRIEGAALTADGTRAVFHGAKELEVESDVTGAWAMPTDHPEQIAALPTHCTWAGLTPDGKYVLTVFKGRMIFWEEKPGAEGGTYQPTGRVLAQAGMSAAVFSADGTRLATWATSGTIIVWDTASWTPLNQIEPEPDWNVGGVSDCAPALSPDGRRLAAAYKKAFVIWDTPSGKSLSDPLHAGAFITKLTFTGAGSDEVEATVSADPDVDRNTQRRSLTWSYADVTELRDGKGVPELAELAEMVAGGDWVAKAPALAAKAPDSPKTVATLLQHFAAQAKVLAAPVAGP